MKILVLATDYSEPNGRVALGYIHSRNKEYVKAGIDVDVLSFSAKTNYVYEEINVYCLKWFEENLLSKQYDILVSHAPNLRNHIRFLLKFEHLFPHLVFFFHGHEVLRTADVYPVPYSYMKHSFVKRQLRCAYDELKLRVLKQYFRKIKGKSHFVFVSQWMANKFFESIGIKSNEMNGRCHIIYNCVGRTFQDNTYDWFSPKIYDFITIRNNLDGSKYAIDVVCRIARSNPEFKFCVVGKGDFFKYNDKPDNIEWIDRNLNHQEIISYLNKARCALLPTRADAQGVMACEMATFGIPLITSDIQVCQEIFRGFENVGYINNEQQMIDIAPLYSQLTKIRQSKRCDKFMIHNTVEKEISLFYDLESSL